jgi:hypothetical protein
MGRKQKTIHYLYKTTCKVTGKYYIGMHSTCNLEDGYMGSGKRLKRSIRKYGEENHVKEILQFFESREDLVEAEKKAITKDMLIDVKCMNLMSGGTGGCYSIEHLKTISHKGVDKRFELIKSDIDYYINWCNQLSIKNKKVYEEGRRSKEYFYDWNGKEHTDLTKQKMRKSKNQGSTNSQYGTMWITNGAENIKIKKDEIIPEGWYKGRL